MNMSSLIPASLSTNIVLSLCELDEFLSRLFILSVRVARANSWKWSIFEFESSIYISFSGLVPYQFSHWFIGSYTTVYPLSSILCRRVLLPAPMSASIEIIFGVDIVVLILTNILFLV